MTLHMVSNVFQQYNRQNCKQYAFHAPSLVDRNIASQLVFYHKLREYPIFIRWIDASSFTLHLRKSGKLKSDMSYALYSKQA
jgi:hypothetical protein